MKTEEQKLTTSIRRWILFFIIALVLSGITAFPLERELNYLATLTPYMPGRVAQFITEINEAIILVNHHYPFMAYGTDWLAFAHIVIAVAFYGPYKNPLRNIWVIEFGMISCALILPLAFICGPIRHIPFYWQLIDCSFGMIGIIPLFYVHRKIKKLAMLQSNQTLLNAI